MVVGRPLNFLEVKFRKSSSLLTVPVFSDLIVVRDQKVSICFAVLIKKELLHLFA